MSQRGRFLVVEDDYVTASDPAEALRSAGARVVGPAPSVAAALAMIAGIEDLAGATLDVRLQGGTAFPLADELVRRGVAFLFVTGCRADVIPKRFAHVAFCEKPFNADRTVALLLA